MLRPRAVLAALIVTLALVATPSAAAPSPSASRARPAAPAPDFEAATPAEQALVDAVLSARERAAAAESRRRRFAAQASALAHRVEQVSADIERLDRAQLNLTVELADARRRLAAIRSRVRRTAVSLYRSGGRIDPAVDLLAGGRSIRDAGSNRKYLEVTGDRLGEDLDAIRVTRAEIRDGQRLLRTRRGTLTELRADLEQRAERVARARDEQQRAVAAAAAEERRERDALAAAQARRREFEAAARRAAEAAEVRRVLTARPATPGRSGTARFRFPASGPVTSPFGERVHPIFHTVRMHTGIDIGAGYGTPVWAGAAGTVVTAGVISGYGNAIVVDHGGGYATLYGHLSRIGVSVGERVDGGETIGAVGNTGNSTGPHLHFEVRVNGTPVDPMPYL